MLNAKYNEPGPECKVCANKVGHNRRDKEIEFKQRRCFDALASPDQDATLNCGECMSSFIKYLVRWVGGDPVRI